MPFTTVLDAGRGTRVVSTEFGVRHEWMVLSGTWSRPVGLMGLSGMSAVGLSCNTPAPHSSARPF